MCKSVPPSYFTIIDIPVEFRHGEENGVMTIEQFEYVLLSWKAKLGGLPYASAKHCTTQPQS